MSADMPKTRPEICLGRSLSISLAAGESGIVRSSVFLVLARSTSCQLRLAISERRRAVSRASWITGCNFGEADLRSSSSSLYSSLLVRPGGILGLCTSLTGFKIDSMPQSRLANSKSLEMRARSRRIVFPETPSTSRSAMKARISLPRIPARKRLARSRFWMAFARFVVRFASLRRGIYSTMKRSRASERVVDSASARETKTPRSISDSISRAQLSASVFASNVFDWTGKPFRWMRARHW